MEKISTHISKQEDTTPGREDFRARLSEAMETVRDTFTKKLGEVEARITDNPHFSELRERF